MTKFSFDIVLCLIFLFHLVAPSLSAQITLIEESVIGVDDGNQNEMFGRVAGIAIDSESNVYILDPSNHRVQKFAKNGEYLRTIGRKGEGPAEFTFPTALTLDRFDNLYVCDRLNIVIFGPDGEYAAEFKHELPGNFIRSLRVDPVSGKVYLTCLDPLEQKVIHVYDAEHRYLRSFCKSYAAGQDIDLRIEGAFGTGLIDVDRQGRIYYTQMTPYEVSVFAHDGSLLGRFERENTFMTPPVVNTNDKGMQLTMPPNCSSIVALDGDQFINVVKIPATPDPPAKTILDLFSIEGDLLASEIFERDFDIKCVDSEGRLYAADHNDYPKVVRYRLAVDF